MKMFRVLITVGVAATILSTAGAASADVTDTQPGSVLGQAEIDTHNPASVFEFSVHAKGNTGVIWMSHHDDEQIGWMVARVDCVRVDGSFGIVTAVVSDAHKFISAPGDHVALTVRDNGTRDSVSFAPEKAKKCRDPRQPELEITRGDFRVSG